jgi:ribonuclease HI
MDYDYELLFDGGAVPNPGRGYGSYRLRTKGGKSRITRLDFEGLITNNQAEYQALLGGLKDLVSTIEEARRNPGDFSLYITGDSQIVLYQLTGKYGVGTAGLVAYYTEAIALVRRFKAVQIEWQKRENIVAVLGH